MPATAMSMTIPDIPRFPKWMIVFFPLGMLLMGWGLNDYSPLHSGVAAGGEVTITRHGTEYVTSVKTVKRVVRGHVHTLPGSQVVVRVPLLIVRTDHHVIKVPAHDVPIKSAGAAVAMPNLPVTVYVTVPVAAEPVTVTVTSTVTSTESVPTTVTVTLPLEGGGTTT